MVVNEFSLTIMEFGTLNYTNSYTDQLFKS